MTKYTEQVAESVQVLLTAGPKTVETITVGVLDEGELVAEWIVDIMVNDIKNIDGETFKSWVGSIAVKMQQMMGRISTATQPSSRTFTVNVGLKQSLSSYRLGADLDWVMADSKDDVTSSATIFPCKSFRSPQIAVTCLMSLIYYFTNVDERISQGSPPPDLLISSTLCTLFDGSNRTIFWVVVEYGT